MGILTRQVLVGALTLVGIAGGARAWADENSCAAVRFTRSLAERRGLDLGDIGRLEQQECASDFRSGGDGRRRGRPGYGGEPIDDGEFDSTVLRAIRGASGDEEANTCRYYARITRVTVAQVIQVVRAVRAQNEAPCALAFYPRVVDPLYWEKVYAPMSSGAERIVRQRVADGR
jgi:hypothetical protein